MYIRDSVEMAWRNVPDELRVKILVNGKLHTLRLLKTLDHRTANLCRRVIRGREWQYIGHNYSDLTEELSDSFDQIRFPLTVSILEDRFKNPEHPNKNEYKENPQRGPPLIAKIHKINLLCMEDGDLTKPNFWNTENDDDRLHRIVDLCVEVVGIGIVSSERGLRMLLQNIVRERGVRLFPVHKKTYDRKSLSKLISGWKDERESDGQLIGTSVSYDDFKNEMTAIELLDSMKIKTEISQNKFAGHAGPYSQDGWELSVRDLMRLKLRPFSMTTIHAYAPQSSG
ncbi:hypothetical protein N9S30_00205 [bacterium]|nr:hypothetical protein [bacterium]